MRLPKIGERVVLLARSLLADAVAGTEGTVKAVLDGLPTRIKVVTGEGHVVVLLVGLDRFVVVLPPGCPGCGNSDPFSFAQDAVTGVVQCDCGVEFDPDEGER